MDIEEFKEELSYLLNPEPDEDGIFPREHPHPRLVDVHGLDFSYFDSDFTWEGSSTHRYTRLCPHDEEAVHVLTRNQDVPTRLFGSALDLFADSMVAYHGKAERKGALRYYPPVILTFWSGFETFVRRLSELMIATVKGVPEPVVNYLRERELFVDGKGHIRERSRFHAVLDRYAVLLAHGYGLHVDRGHKFWQGLNAAKELRDYYTHLDITDPRAISSQEVLQFMEAVMLSLIWPSSVLQRTLLLGIFRVYEVWELLFRYAEEYREQPMFMDWHLKSQYLFHCNFENVDANRFPNMDQKSARRKHDAQG